MHIPDGILPVGLWLFGLIVMVLAVGFSLFHSGDGHGQEDPASSAR